MAETALRQHNSSGPAADHHSSTQAAYGRTSSSDTCPVGNMQTEAALTERRFLCLLQVHAPVHPSLLQYCPLWCLIISDAGLVDLLHVNVCALLP